MRHPQDWTGGRLSGTPYYQTGSTLTYVFTGNYLLLPSYLGCTTSQGLFHLGISFCCWVKGMRVTFCVFWSLFSYYQACWRTRRLCIRSTNSWRRWWSKRHEVRMLLMPILPDLGPLSSNCQGVRISVSASELKEFYCTTTGRFLWPGTDPLIVWIYYTRLSECKHC